MQLRRIGGLADLPSFYLSGCRQKGGRYHHYPTAEPHFNELNVFEKSATSR
jgi:hypothetical protein